MNIFDIVEGMIQTERGKRLGLQETIDMAEEMYEQQDQGVSRLSLTDRLNNSDKKIELKRTTHSSSGKKRSSFKC